MLHTHPAQIAPSTPHTVQLAHNICWPTKPSTLMCACDTKATSFIQADKQGCLSAELPTHVLTASRRIQLSNTAPRAVVGRTSRHSPRTHQHPCIADSNTKTHHHTHSLTHTHAHHCVDKPPLRHHCFPHTPPPSPDTLHFSILWPPHFVPGGSPPACLEPATAK